jgi:Cache domain
VTASALLEGVARDLEEVLASVTAIREVALALVNEAEAAGQPLGRGDLRALRGPAVELLRRHEGFAAGAGIVLAPDVLPDVSRWLEWWWSDGAAGVARLEVDLDPDSAEFYDYTTTEWYREPERTGERWVAGPYVDYICTHQATFTVSVPLLPGARFLGVAGADILAEQVERMVLPRLARLAGTAVLASADGRVIASNSAGFLPGVVLDRQPGSADLVAREVTASLPWQLLESA